MSHLLLKALAFPVLMLLAGSAPVAEAQTVTNTDPDAARLVTEDIPRFWAAYDASAAEDSADARAANYERLYLAPGSAGLRAFLESRIGDAGKLVATMDKHPRYYASLRAHTDGVGRYEAPIRVAMRRLAEIHPEAVFPDVYFLVGRMNSGGTISPAGLLIGLEMYGRYPQTPDAELGDWHRTVLRDMDGLPHIVAHELVHYQQKYEIPGEANLLQKSIYEGTADFLCELISGQHINPQVHAWAEPRAGALWLEFQAAMHGTSHEGWLYGAAPGSDRPADLGYWMGYRIARAYYDQATDKEQAVRDMLTIRDFDAFLARSGVAMTFGTHGQDPATP